MSRPLDFVLRANADYIDAQHSRWQADPASVPPEWALFFAGVEVGARRDRGEATAQTTSEGGAQGVIHAYREFGHLVARLDPLGSGPQQHPFLELAAHGLSEADLDRPVSGAPFLGEFGGTLRQLIEALRSTYCGTLAVEYMDISDPARREWLADQIERGLNRPRPTPGERVRILRALLAADGFEHFLHARYTGQKRFSLEGAASLIPMFESLTVEAGLLGVETLRMGMPHRGRLNFLANILKKPLEEIFSEFEGSFLPEDVQGHGDVKYHLGYSSSMPLPNGRSIALSLCYNPSHLEFVNPVVLGSLRAKQQVAGDTTRTRGVPVLIHGDAAFAGEGIVAETLALAQLPAYVTGGTIHVIVNNQVGFTTSPEYSRPTRYPTAIARALDAPVFHVNGDDPEACVRAMSLALAWRMRFQRDVFIDLVCYRLHGHNEMDDPTFTQPVMYKAIAEHVPAARRYAGRLVAEGVLDSATLEKIESELAATFRAAHRKATSDPVPPNRGNPAGLWRGLEWAGEDWSADTRVPRATLEQILHGLTNLPEDFRPHRKIAQLAVDRRKMLLEDRVDWSLGESLAYGSLLLEGRNVRLSGQDSGRGTFTHRHAMLHDAEDGRRWVPLQHLAPEQGRFEIVDTMLSEAAVLGFEYGYSTADPHTLVIWEAQFGDFANAAQVIVDQFVASGEAKWGRMSGLTLYLPHGYEGQGPEHSSARLERFLELCADRNMQVCNLTTPAQLFHALRRQLHRRFRKPLVLMSPKSLLRHKLAVSRVEEFERGAFQVVIDDPRTDVAAVTRALIVSGKLYYALLEARAAGKREDVAILRLEQLYPFPGDELKAALARYPNLKEVRWVQEEPANMGGWRAMRHRIDGVRPAGTDFRRISRPAASSPATGYYGMHQQQEQQLLAEAFGATVVDRDSEGRPARAMKGARP
ncbi:MAG: 2-oxoglutarate dehydrogenase E1 component [Candidatus Eisenbacteria bacterium]|nr:2-oxoglutarate dehydrogenase E1 component [Candidatus Eisenbacteria bacterium]